MSIKAKPDLSSFQKGKAGDKKDPAAFLEGAEADQAEQPQVAKKAKKPGVQKIFRLHPDLVHALRMHCVEQGIAQERRVTETEVIESLLADLLNIKLS